MPFPIFGGLPQFFDNNGDPLASGRLYVYLEGTVNLATIYKNVALSQAHANPLTLQADGRPDAPLIGDDGAALKFELRSSVASGEVLLMTADGIRVPNGKRVLADDGTAPLPAYSFSLDPDTGFYREGANDIRLSVGGVFRANWTTSQHTLRLQILGQDGTVALPAYSFESDPDTGLYRQGANALGLVAGGAEGARVDASAVADDTRLLLYDVTAGTMKRVSRGAVDSGGAGFRLLRIPNA